MSGFDAVPHPTQDENADTDVTVWSRYPQYAYSDYCVSLVSGNRALYHEQVEPSHGIYQP